MGLVLADPQCDPCGQILASNHSRAASSVGNIFISLISEIPSRSLFPGPLCVMPSLHCDSRRGMVSRENCDFVCNPQCEGLRTRCVLPDAVYTRLIDIEANTVPMFHPEYLPEILENGLRIAYP